MFFKWNLLVVKIRNVRKMEALSLCSFFYGCVLVMIMIFHNIECNVIGCKSMCESLIYANVLQKESDALESVIPRHNRYSPITP